MGFELLILVSKKVEPLGILLEEFLETSLGSHRMTVQQIFEETAKGLIEVRDTVKFGNAIVELQAQIMTAQQGAFTAQARPRIS